MSQRHADEFIRYTIHFQRVRLEKIPARRYIEKQVLDRNGRPLRGRAPDCIDIAGTFDHHGRGQFVLASARSHLHLSHCGYRSQSLAAETLGVQAEQVFGRRYLGSGVP